MSVVVGWQVGLLSLCPEWRAPSIVEDGMTLRAFVVSGLLTAATTVPVLADDAKAPVQVSVQVVRSCRITTDQPEASVNCGTAAQTVQVSAGQTSPAGRTLSGPTTVAPTSAATVTIHF